MKANSGEVRTKPPMIRAQALLQLYRLDRRKRKLLLRALVLLTLVPLALALLPFETAIRLGSVALRSAPWSLEECRWAVECAARRVPSRTMCIEKGLVLQRLLRLAGIDARLHYGARHHPDSRELEAHVWITVAGEAVLGGEEAQGFAQVATYP